MLIKDLVKYLLTLPQGDGAVFSVCLPRNEKHGELRVFINEISYLSISVPEASLTILLANGQLK